MAASPSASELITQAGRLMRQVAAHKAEIRRHRAALGTAKAAFDALAQECAQRGIRLIVTAPSGVGVIHGHRSVS